MGLPEKELKRASTSLFESSGSFCFCCVLTAARFSFVKEAVPVEVLLPAAVTVGAVLEEEGALEEGGGATIGIAFDSLLCKRGGELDKDAEVAEVAGGIIGVGLRGVVE